MTLEFVALTFMGPLEIIYDSYTFL